MGHFDSSDIFSNISKTTAIYMNLFPAHMARRRKKEVNKYYVCETLSEWSLRDILIYKFLF